MLPNHWSDPSADIELHEIFETDATAVFLVGEEKRTEIGLRKRSELFGFMEPFAQREVFIDITGLSHHVWMPILRLAVEANYKIRCIYSEPEAYKETPNPRPSEFFDLSSKIRGVAPIPTFSKLSKPRELSPVFVPLLGFEGTRFKHVMETLQPEGQNIFPVIGVPGFKLEFPFHTYRGNADALSSDRAWENVLLADASCPFSLYETLASIKVSHPKKYMQVSPIGTKPHALGAALFAIFNSETELVYDHPIRKKKRSRGYGKCHVYYLNEYIEDRIK